MAATPLDYECHLQAVYEAVLRPGDVALDVGAHFGRHTLPLAQRVGPTGQVLAFEPIPQCRRELQRAIAHEHRGILAPIQLFPMALGAVETQTEFVIACDALGYSGLRERPYDWPTRVKRIPIEVRTLDAMTATLPSLRFIKIDAEGAELDILNGSVQTLKRLRPVVAFEAGGRSLSGYGHRPEDLARFWQQHQFKVFNIKGQLLDEPTLASQIREEQTWDYLAVPQEQHETCELVGTVLRRCWQLGPVIRAVTRCQQLDKLNQTLPSLTRVPTLLRPLARATAWVILRLTRFQWQRQQEMNHHLLNAIEWLSNELLRAQQAEQGNGPPTRIAA